LPLVEVEDAHFELTYNKININVQADDIFVSFATIFVNTLKPTFLGIMQQIINNAFPMMANLAIKGV
jgi:hypothetical protein